MTSIPVSVIVTVKNEAARINRCLSPLKDFDEIVVVDSGSTDDTVKFSQEAGANVIPFHWNGQYPKKRQWCLDTLRLKNDWIFFVDADEVVTPELSREIANLFGAGAPPCAGYFVAGRYVVKGKTLRFGLANNKLVLFDRRLIGFPVIDDIGLPGMGEMEGHYQPVLKLHNPPPPALAGGGVRGGGPSLAQTSRTPSPPAPLSQEGGGRRKFGQIKAFMLHEAYETGESWRARHLRYAAWEAGMNNRNAWPGDPLPWRQTLKKIFRALPCRPLAAFCHCYIFKRGFMDGLPGLKLAADRYRYYRMVGEAGR